VQGAEIAPKQCPIPEAEMFKTSERRLPAMAEMIEQGTEDQLSGLRNWIDETALEPKHRMTV
jgi:hypothetical protein